MSARWRSMLLLVVVGLVGAAASVHLYRWALRQDDERIRTTIDFRAHWRVADLAWKFDSSGHVIAALAALIAADPDVSLDKFARVNAEPLRRLRSTTAVGWTPRVPGDGRERFEAAIRAAGIPGYRILEPGPGGFVPASVRDEYFPLLHAWVFEGAPAILGLDALSNPLVRAAADAARDSGELTATIPLRSDVTGLVTLQTVAPVYLGDGLPGSPEERRDRLRGHVIGRMPLIEALGRAVDGTPEISEDIYFFHEPGVATQGPARPFAEYRAATRSFSTNGGAIDLAALPGVTVVKPVEVLNTRWSVAFHVRPELIAAQRTPGLWGLPVAGLLATAGIVAFLAFQLRRVRLSERLVAERTADLHHEAEERERIEQMAGTIIEQSPFAIVGLRPDRQVMLWNRAAERIFGYSAEEAVGRPYALVPEEGQAEFDRIVERVSSGERLTDVEVRRRRKDGTIVDVVFSGAPLFDPAGGLVGLVFVLQDVTERKAIEAQLRQSQKMEAIGQLSGGIAHDFNNMLGAIIGNLEVALDETRDPAAVGAQIERAIGVATRGGELVQRLLAFARRQMLVPKRIDVGSAIDSVVPILRRTLGESIKVTGAHEPGLWPVLADPAQLESALLNLAINARDAMPRGGALTITADNVAVDADMAPLFPDLRPGDYVRIAVADTGSGMPPEVVARAFEPFFTTKGAGKGTGLGLSMVYGFMKQSGGTAKIYSEVGHGTTIHLYMPRTDAAAATSAPASDAAAPVPGGSERVLVVEDNADMREVASKMLKGLGYRITTAVDAAEALRRIDAEGPFDLLFSDVVMPGMSGIELAQEVRRRGLPMKILLTSGFASPVAVRDQARSNGFEVLTKPYRRPVLAAKIREVLEKPA